MEIVEKCFGPISFECVDFQRLSQISAKLTRENLAEREAEITNLPWTQKKTMRLLDAPGVSKNQCFAKAVSLMKRAIPWTTKMNQEEGFVSIGEPFSKQVSKARDIITTKKFYGMSSRLLMTSAGLLTRPSLTTSLL